MKKMDNKNLTGLYYGVFICTLFSAILCFVIGDGDLSYDKYVTAFYRGQLWKDNKYYKPESYNCGSGYKGLSRFYL